MTGTPLRRFIAAVAAVSTVLATTAASAAPAAGQSDDFADVPDDAYYSQPVATLAGRGVFGDTLCDGGFCPEDPIDRKTMAVWTVRVLDGRDPPATTRARFDDVDVTSFYAPFIERMAELGVTGGCGDGSGFCPDRNVTRAQMAVFLSRAYTLPEGPDPMFSDIPDNAWYAREVAKLAASGITAGCGDGTKFCPSQDTTRAQMATFLYRAETWGVPEARPVTLNPSMEGGGVITAGAFHSCAIRTDKTVTCWGHNDEGQTNVPGGPFTAISSYLHTCGLRIDQTVTCWGSNIFGKADPPGGAFTSVSAGFAHSCGIWPSQTVHCWGSNLFGQTPSPDIADPWEHIFEGFTAVSAGGSHSCGLTADDMVACWGSNADGQSESPVGSFTAVSAGGSHSCGLRTDQTITCWGDDTHGQLSAPVGLFMTVSAGGAHSCGLRTDRTVSCWGWNDHGQLNNIPAGGFIAVSAGNIHSCGLSSDNTIACWGDNTYGQSNAPTGQFGP